MKAVRFHEHGGLEVLRYDEVPDPVPAPGEVLVKVKACALNHLDLWQRRGIPGVPLPHCPGSDVAGEVVRGEAPGVAEGQRVLVQPGISCGRCAACLGGEDNLCRSFGLVGYQSEGGYAELTTVPVENIVPIPDRIGFVEAAAFPMTFLTAWHMLVTRAELRPGETVLILAAGSGVGQAAVQVARAHGARVIVTAGSEQKLARARELGAHEGIDHYTQDISKEVRRFTDRRGVDVVFEHVGQATWEQSMKSLRRGGRLVTCGATAGPSVSIDIRHLFQRQISLIGSYMGSKGELLTAAELFFDGRFNPVVDRTYPLEAAAEAQGRLEDSEQFGKVVLEV
ncbi:MAG: alcohol dehydrogenase [Acidobacteria bacterium]|jgi:NADPH:quinone reductase-like Zn-dependent oxidoreductase|nr:alcohol dehydrogenase [Acidobacteriota bacterium]MDP7338692.1 zinc-binding dehydrogenase [Vicinamibacterales bacterium]MDP7691642.1 zinc-binding dehydrogenase [Vicinamibacterales bacterium]HJN46358.1 zinc-binding dehydrogenase [Vicinamibacterales bacterium]|tara:strand:+ start:327 stop:1343 length:1017 start_codon:yes stop_codon:yes gene_type:complete